MIPIRVAAPLALGAIALSAGMVFSAAAGPGPVEKVRLADGGPLAHSAGTDVVALAYPSMVNVHLVRAQSAMDRAATLVDQGRDRQVAVELAAARSNMTKAWTAAKYVIKTAPPPIVVDDAFAHADATTVGATMATPEDTGVAVLYLQHDIITTATGLLDRAAAAVLPELRTTITAAMNARDTAVAFIHTLVPPVTEDRVTAHASEEPIGWDALMPGVVPLLDDEIQQMTGIMTINPAVSPSFLQTSKTQVTATSATVSLYWPPVVVDD